MGWFHRKTEAERDKERLCQRIDGRRVHTVTRRLNEGGAVKEAIVGREGRVAFHDGWAVVMANGQELFRAPLAQTQVAELMSLGGVIISGENQLTHQPDTLVAYYPSGWK